VAGVGACGGRGEVEFAEEIGGAAGGVEVAAAAVDIGGRGVGGEFGESVEIAEDLLDGATGDDGQALAGEAFDGVDVLRDLGLGDVVEEGLDGDAEGVGDCRGTAVGVDVMAEELIEVDDGEVMFDWVVHADKL
jgi:hypothetical protein